MLCQFLEMGVTLPSSLQSENYVRTPVQTSKAGRQSENILEGCRPRITNTSLIIYHIVSEINGAPSSNIFIK